MLGSAALAYAEFVTPLVPSYETPVTSPATSTTEFVSSPNDDQFTPGIPELSITISATSVHTGQSLSITWESKHLPTTTRFISLTAFNLDTLEVYPLRI